MAEKVIRTGDLVWGATAPLALWSQVGEPGYWLLGIVLSDPREKKYRVLTAEGISKVSRRYLRLLSKTI